MDLSSIKQCVGAAVESLVMCDAQLFALNAGERTVAGRLQVYLSALFPCFSVDIEYSRHGVDIKRLERNAACRGKVNPSRIFPDIVIHNRGTDANNLLAIEIKPRSADAHDLECDREKLAGLREQYGYRYTLLLVYPQDEHSAPQDFVYDWQPSEH